MSQIRWADQIVRSGNAYRTKFRGQNNTGTSNNALDGFFAKILNEARAKETPDYLGTRQGPLESSLVKFYFKGYML